MKNKPLVLFCFLVITFITYFTGSITFTFGKAIDSDQLNDVPSSHWARNDILKGISKGYITGYPDGSFRPDDLITQEEFLAMMVRSMGFPINEKIIPASSWFAPYFDVAIKSGLYQYDFSRGWSDHITRGDVAQTVVRATSSTSPIGKNFSRDRMIYEATKRGLLTGNAIGALDLEKEITRAQAITVIERVLAYNNGTELQSEKRAMAQAEVLWHRTNVFTMWREYLSNKYDRLGNIIEKAVSPEDSFDSGDNFVFQMKDGSHKVELTGLYIIDLEDPDDPFLDKLPALKKELFWAGRLNDKRFNIQSYPQSYVVVWNQNVISNDYSPQFDNGLLQISIRGIGKEINYYKHRDVFDRRENGELMGVTHLGSEKSMSARALIIPKKTFSQDHLSIRVVTGLAGTTSNVDHVLFSKDVYPSEWDDYSAEKNFAIPIELK